MSRFSIRNPYFIIVMCLAVLVIGITSVARMPSDLFPPINLPQVVVATFYSGMPPEDVEIYITNPLERFFTLASGIDHIESRSLLGVSIINVYFQPGTSLDADVTQISNLALADLRRLPQGTLPPVVLPFGASSLPVALVTVKGQGLTETQLHDYAQFQIRDQIAILKGAEIPPPFGGKYRQIMVYVDPYKLASRQLSPMDVVNAVNQSTLILPAGDVKMGPYDYYVYSNSVVDTLEELNATPVKTVGTSWAAVSDVGRAEDAHQIQYNVVRVDGQKSSYIAIIKQAGASTIQVVDALRKLIGHLFNIPKQMKASLVFDQSVYVKQALNSVLAAGMIGLVLTSLMILIFLGKLRPTAAILLSIPLSVVATFVMLYLWGSTVNTMVLGGLALAFSRVLDNSVISLENIYRRLEKGEPPAIAAEAGGAEVSLAILAATLVAVIVFFPVTFLYGVSKFLFSSLALAFALSLLTSYVIAMTVIPLFCSRFLTGASGEAPSRPSFWARFSAGFNRGYNKLLDSYERAVRRALKRPGMTVALLFGLFLASLAIFPFLGVAFFPRTDAGQFAINLKVPVGTRIEISDSYVGKVEDLIRRVVSSADLKTIVSNIGIVPDFSALYTTNAGPYTATIQVALNENHKVSSFEYMDRVRDEMARNFPEIRTFFGSGSMVDAVLNMGMPAPIDVQVSGSNLNQIHKIAQDLAGRIRTLQGVGQVYVPQDINYPSVRMTVDRVHAAELGLTQKDVVENVITALNSNYQIAPNYWVDRQSGNAYYLTVQYFEHGRSAIHDSLDLKNIPLKAPKLEKPTTLDTVVKLTPIETPTEVDHYQIQRVSDVYVTPSGEDLGKLTDRIRELVKNTSIPEDTRIDIRGIVNEMEESFKSFGLGFVLSFILLYLILIAQFRSFLDPILVMLAIPMGFIGVLLVLPLTHTTLNVMSLVGVLMLVGVADSNSILIVDVAHRMEAEGASVEEAAIGACRVRLRPILMTSLATILGLIPLAGAGQYAPMARAIIGGLASSVLLTIFIVPAAYVFVYRRRTPRRNQPAP
jgi:hydrophobic/amphiphilic exporter-1 (mainly G- bacteria), HAE1 family